MHATTNDDKLRYGMASALEMRSRNVYLKVLSTASGSNAEPVRHLEQGD
jgi:hypothetical protein